MEDLYLDFSLSPDRLARLLAAPRAITRVRAGEHARLDPARNPLTLEREQPPVDRMEGDLGAICETYRQSAVYFARVSGVTLEPGDELVVEHAAGETRLRVIEVEGGRARVEAVS